MDIILDTLQGRAFHLPEETYSFLSGRHEELISIPVNKTSLKGTHPETLGKLITLHREQFSTDEYTESRIKNPTSGTIDHLHAEIAADYALRLGQRSHLSVDALTLLQTAAHLHDIDRSFPSRMIKGEERLRHDPEGYQQFKKKHAANSSEIAKTLTLKILKIDCLAGDCTYEKTTMDSGHMDIDSLINLKSKLNPSRTIASHISHMNLGYKKLKRI